MCHTLWPAEAKQIITNFIWEGKPLKITSVVLTQSIKHGGMKLITFQSKVNFWSTQQIKLRNATPWWEWRAMESSCCLLLKTINVKLYFSSNQPKSDYVYIYITISMQMSTTNLHWLTTNWQSFDMQTKSIKQTKKHQKLKLNKNKTKRFVNCDW